MLDFVKFKYCPRCGQQQLQPNDAKSLGCLACGFVYYHATAAVVTAIIEYDHKLILTQRAHEPHKGLLALPGGFVDYDETLENAMIREIQEELNLTITTPVYLCSHSERYLSRDVVYFCAVAFYVVRVDDLSNIAARDDVDAFLLIDPDDIDDEKLAFETDGAAIDEYRKLRQE